MDGDDTGRIEVRLRGDLAWFCADATDEGVVHVAVTGRRSLKDLVESVGVPHVEVGHVLVDGRRRPLGDVVEDVTLVSVHPPEHCVPPGVDASPPTAPRTVADVHLGALARLLRLLGIDTRWERDADDDRLTRWAVAERRVLLSRDRHLLMRRVVSDGYCPRSDDPDTQLREVVERYRLRPWVRPFGRCARCNGEIEAVPRSAVLALVPPRVAREHERFSRCRDCGRVYWEGSHVAALRDRLGDLLPPEVGHGGVSRTGDRT